MNAMKEKARVQVKIDKELKENAELIFDELGINATTAINMFYKQVVINGGIPMDLKISEKEQQQIRFQQLVKKIPVVALDTDEKIEEFFDEGE